MPPVLAALLWLRWPSVRRIRLWRLALYPLILTPVVYAAQLAAAYAASGRVLPIEVFWAIWFVLAWRLAWAVWVRMVGRIGEPYRRLARQRRRLQVAPHLRWARGIAPVRAGLTLLVFIPFDA